MLVKTMRITFDYHSVDENTPNITDCEPTIMHWPQYGWQVSYYDDNRDFFVADKILRKEDEEWIQENQPTFWACLKDIPIPTQKE